MDNDDLEIALASVAAKLKFHADFIGREERRHSDLTDDMLHEYMELRRLLNEIAMEPVE